VARGFESKDVEFQQAEAARADDQRGARGTRRKNDLSAGSAMRVVGPATPEERAAQAKRRTIELALARAKGDLIAARSDAHRQMLTEAIAVLQQRLNEG
jgi:hypothetical protein